MNLILTVLEIVAPVAILASIGFIWVKAGFEYRMEFVTRLAMMLATPCLVFTALMKTEIEPAALTSMLLAAIATYGALTLLFWGLTAVLGLERRTYLPPLIFGNTGNLGLPLALFAFGEAGIGYAVVIFAVAGIWGFTYGIWLVSQGGSPLKVLREPLVVSTLLGALFLWQGWHTPTWLTNALEMIGQMAIPLMLITLGVAVARLSPGRLGQALWLSLLRVAVCVAVALGVGLGFALEPVALAVLVLQISTPVAVTTYMLAAKYGADADAVAGMVIVSTLLSVITLPLTLAFLI
ncbi:AEC family transporter [Pseudorhodobacter turbinis]|uniref:AEC family transporter n=1 Tax=Pseudorhodobacter turbinis TaxID=2500533 RepID=A0A4P8EGW3_9RHOB|nr:AEC family transporter [Pseudorhodobacter turbinis]QCO55775.1 AEC family transporter [Pseudorhodobacter turbinis]